MGAHDDVLPAIIEDPTPQQKEEVSLRMKYKNYKQKNVRLTDAQHALQEEINRRATNQKDLDVLEEVARFSAKNNHKLPAASSNLGKKLRRLQKRKSNSDFTETPRGAR